MQDPGYIISRLRFGLYRGDSSESVSWKRYAKEAPRKPIGLLRAHTIKRLFNVPSDRKLSRRLESDSGLRYICDMAEGREPYIRSCFSDFRKTIEPERLQRIADHVVRELLKGQVIKGEKIASDTTFIKA